MRILIIGGGPGGLYAALLLKRVNAGYDIQVVERNPAGATYGWGVVFSDRTLNTFREADPKTYQEISDNFVTWQAIDICYRGEIIRCDGHSFAGIARRQLLHILQTRCLEVGVQLTFESEWRDFSDLGRYDLVVAADGVNSQVRQTLAAAFQPRLETGKARYIWLGSERVLDAFTFIFRQNEHGLFQAHAYPFDGRTSTFIVECAEEVWQRAGLDQAGEAESIAYCQALFDDFLQGHALLSNKSEWINFVTLKNKTWHHHNIVLLGDAAHTAHFSIGSGTKMAMEDAISLALAFVRSSDVAIALNQYEMERRPIVEILQTAAQGSQAYFENIKRYLHLEPIQFATQLLTRSGRINYDNLRLRDPYFVETIDRTFPKVSSIGTARAARVEEDGDRGSQSAPLLVPPPLFTPFQVRGMTLINRVVLSPQPGCAAVDGIATDEYLEQLLCHAHAGAALLLTQPVAVSAGGRITPECAGLYDDAHQVAWRRLVEAVHNQSAARVAVQLNHAGRRGSTRPRRQGLDRPLRHGGWPLLAASPIPYSASSQMPGAVDDGAMAQVIADFVRAATMAAAAGFDWLQLHMAHGYLLAGFLSPLANRRQDEYGGSLENRLRFPLELFDAVRAVWPAERPLSVALPAIDWVRGGLTIVEAVTIATALKAHGCDLVEVLAGQTVPDSSPVYGSDFLAGYSEQIRHEAALPTLTRGYITTSGQVNTILAAGRADLCLMELGEP
jgi:anthraniloyl-CoA monooxygenase